MKRNFFVLTWKPEVNEDFKEEQFNALAKTCWKNGFVDSSWRFNSQKYQEGDAVIVLRQGKESGLVGVGRVIENSGNSADERTHYAAVRLLSMRDTFEHPFVSKKQLLGIGLRRSVLETQASGQLCLNETEIVALLALLRSTARMNSFLEMFN
jgi:hypothetical protein